tara:strand:- start:1461 stop:1748 length:288 start_codon:yes stop_codon:yes gene_type:complete
MSKIPIEKYLENSLKLLERKTSKKRGIITATLNASSFTECTNINAKSKMTLAILLTPVKRGNSIGPEYLANIILKKTTEVDMTAKSSFLNPNTIP